MRILSPRIGNLSCLSWIWPLMVAAMGLSVCAMLPPREALATDTVSREEFRKELALVRNSPNPFNPSTTIYYNLLQPAKVRVDVYDLRGHLVVCLEDSWQDAGENMAVWKTQTAPSGTYLVSLQADDVLVFFKMSLVR